MILEVGILLHILLFVSVSLVNSVPDRNIPTWLQSVIAPFGALVGV